MKKDETTKLTSSVSAEEREMEETEQIGDEKDTVEQYPNVEKLKGRPWLPYVITFVVLAALTLLVAWAEGGYSHAPTWLLIGYWGSSVAISGIIAISFGVLVWASNGGAFDIFAYGGRTFVRMFFKKDVLDRKYPTYYDYRESRKKKKRNFWFVAIVGGVYFVVGIVLSVVSKQLMPK